MLLAIAVCPLRVPHWWEANRNKLIVSAALGLPVLAMYGVSQPATLLHTAQDYVSFIVLLAGYVVVAMLALAMGIQNAMVRVHGVPDIATNVMTVTFTGIFADSTPAGGTNRNWRRRMTSVGLFMAGAALGGLLLQFGTVWPLVLTSVVFSLAMIPLMFGEKPPESTSMCSLN